MLQDTAVFYLACCSPRLPSSHLTSSHAASFKCSSPGRHEYLRRFITKAILAYCAECQKLSREKWEALSSSDPTLEPPWVMDPSVLPHVFCTRTSVHISPIRHPSVLQTLLPEAQLSTCMYFLLPCLSLLLAYITVQDNGACFDLFLPICSVLRSHLSSHLPSLCPSPCPGSPFPKRICLMLCAFKKNKI